MLPMMLDTADKMKIQNTFHDVHYWIIRANKIMDIAVGALLEIQGFNAANNRIDCREIAEEALDKIREI